MAQKPYIDEDVCIGCELCVNTAPEVFRMKEDSIAEVMIRRALPKKKSRMPSITAR